MKFLGAKTTPTARQLGAPVVAALLIMGACVNQTIASTVVGWGNNQWGQTNVPPDLTNAIAIAAGSSHSLALRSDGTMVGWGSTSMALSVILNGLSNVIAIAAGGSNSLALKADGTVSVWGTNMFGPAFVPTGLTSVVAIAR